MQHPLSSPTPPSEDACSTSTKIPDSTSDEFHLSSVYGLPFLLIGDVLDIWTVLKTRIWILYPTSAITDFITYFEKTWIFSTSNPISMWNISSAVEYDEPRTNNASEGGNTALNRAFSASHPSMWTFISTLRKFHSWVETKYQQTSVGTATLEPVAERWRVRKARIKHVVESYNPADKLDFLRKIGYLF